MTSLAMAAMREVSNCLLALMLDKSIKIIPMNRKYRHSAATQVSFLFLNTPKINLTTHTITTIIKS